LVKEREARLAALDVAIARGLADGDASRLRSAASAFDHLDARYAASIPANPARRPSAKKR
jgi:antitoxin ParD1/3/4